MEKTMVPLRQLHRNASARINFALSKSSHSSSAKTDEKFANKTTQECADFTDSCSSISLHFEDDEEMVIREVTSDAKRNNTSGATPTNSNKKITTKFHSTHSEGPLRRICRNASARLFASLHSSKTSTIATELIDSATSLSLADFDADGDDSDDESVCSFEDDGSKTAKKQVRFDAHPDTVHEVEHCHYMQPQQRADCWYSR